MNTLIAFALLVGVAFASEPANCPAWQPFNDFTSECVWYPLNNMRRKIVEHCGLPPPPGGFPEGTMIPFPSGESMPTSPCGNCGYKMRCRKRGLPPTDGCFLLDAEKKACGNEEHAGYGDVCNLPKTVRGDCYWGQYLAGLKQCLNANPNLPLWRREGYQKMLKILPSGHCVEKDGRCKCCCDPYWPSEDGASCVKREPDHCPAFGEFNGWSQCLWYPEAELIQGIRSHCELTGGPARVPFPEPSADVQIPEKCGWCSFKVRCKKREEHEGCFHVIADKQNCGPSDCPTCGSPCEMNKIDNGCDYAGRLTSRVKNAVVQMQKAAEASGKKIPRWKKEGYLRMLSLMPHGKCIEKNDKCHCCCHPFEPKEGADGTITCAVKSTCQGPWMSAPPTL